VGEVNKYFGNNQDRININYSKLAKKTQISV